MNTRNLTFILMLALAATTWTAYAQHPTARNLRRAIRDTLPLL